MENQNKMKFTEAFPTIKFTDTELEQLADVEVIKVIHFRKMNVLKVFIEAGHILKNDCISGIETKIAKAAFPNGESGVKLCPKYMLENQLSPMEIMKLYKDVMLYEISNNDALMGVLFDGAAIKEEEDGLEITIGNKLMAEFKGDDIKKYVETVLLSRFGLDCKVKISVDESMAKHHSARTETEVLAAGQFANRVADRGENAAGSVGEANSTLGSNETNADKDNKDGFELQQSRMQVGTSQNYDQQEFGAQQANQQEFGGQISASNVTGLQGNGAEQFRSQMSGTQEKGAEQFATQQSQSQSKAKKKSNWVPKRKDPNLFYGRNTIGAIIPMEELDKLEGEVVIRGEILSYEEKKLKKEGLLLVILTLTDYTDSITTKIFVKEELIEDLRPELEEGKYILIKGVVALDSFSKEKSMSSIVGIGRTNDFSYKRMDTAGKKRVELHCHTKASDMDGVANVKDIVKTAYKWGMPGVAITDHGVVYACPDANHAREDLWKGYKKACEKDGKDPGRYEDFFKVIYGVEGYLVNDIEDDEPDKPIQKKETYHIILLAKNEIGRVNLYRLISKSHLEYYAKRPRIPKSELLKHREGLVIGSACERGEIYRAIVGNKSDEDIKQLVGLYDYLEIQPTGNNNFMILDDEKYPDVRSEEDLRDFNRKIVELGDELGKPVVATCDVHFLNPQDEIYRRIIMTSKGYSDADNQAPLYFRTTDEMLDEFSYLGVKKAEEVVITNSNLIADSIEAISPVRPDKCPPVIENSDETLREICTKKAHDLYGENLPKIVKERMDKELNSIINNGYSVMYIIAQKLVWKSIEDGYLVGSRGSVGSSFAAFLAGITEVNSLAPHYRCGKCFYTDFDSEEVQSFSGGSGCDMPDKVCPVCGEMLIKDGFDIPFETFLGFNGDKEPDIDLNFSSEYQANAHKYTEEIFGKGQTFKAGTIGAVAEKTAYGMIRTYHENRGFHKRRCEIERLVKGCSGVRRSTGQHPGGIVVLPKGEEINTFTPVQHPANDMTSDIITTHFDYHSIDHNLLKLDELGHDDPSMIRALQDLTGLDPTKIPLDDKKVMSLFTSPKALGLEPEDIFGWRVGSLGIPEFGTGFVEKMLIDANPTQFSDLIRIAGLGHGTDVWTGNAQELIKKDICTISTAICCRDDIMVYLIHMGLEPGMAFKIMENVRKGKAADGTCDKWPEWKEEMKSHGIPDWYIWSCEKIKYMFPKAHAAAYVMMAWRIAYCKLYYPLEYYTAYFSIRADNFSYGEMCQGRDDIEYRMKQMIARFETLSSKEQDKLKDMRSVQEMYARGIEFMPIDLYKAKANKFQIIDGKIMPAFSSIQGLGGKAAENIEMAAKENKFISIDDLKSKAGIGDSVVAAMAEYGILDGLPKSNQLSIFDFMKMEG